LTEIVPELNAKSASDICLKQDGILCVIMVSNGKPDKDNLENLKLLN